MGDLGILIERVEQCTGADEEVDAEIAYASGWERRGWALETGCEGWFEPGVPNVMHTAPPAYTADLNAVYTLIERLLPDAWWDVRKEVAFGTVNYYGCVAHIRTFQSSATPALALLLALLRALKDKGE